MFRHDFIFIAPETLKNFIEVLGIYFDVNLNLIVHLCDKHPEQFVAVTFYYLGNFASGIMHQRFLDYNNTSGFSQKRCITKDLDNIRKLIITQIAVIAIEHRHNIGLMLSKSLQYIQPIRVVSYIKTF